MDEPSQETRPRPDNDSDGEIESRRRELDEIVQAGPSSGNRTGALAFLALVIVLGAAVYYYLTEQGPSAYANRLDAELISHAELSVASMEEDNRMTVVPGWPVRLYDRLRRDIALYAALAAAAAWVWSLAARAAARRNAFLIHETLHTELDALRRRVDELENAATGSESSEHMKG